MPTYDGTAFAQRTASRWSRSTTATARLAGFAHLALEKANSLDRRQLSPARRHGRPALGEDEMLPRSAATPANITLFGESAGATMVANLITSPQAKACSRRPSSNPPARCPPQARPSPAPTNSAPPSPPPAPARARTATAVPAPRHPGRQDHRRRKNTRRPAHHHRQHDKDPIHHGQLCFKLGARHPDDHRHQQRRRTSQRNAARRHHADDWRPVWQYFFDYVPQVRRAENPNGAPHAADCPSSSTPCAPTAASPSASPTQTRWLQITFTIAGCAFAKQPSSRRTITCGKGFEWPARMEANSRDRSLSSRQRLRFAKLPTFAPHPTASRRDQRGRDED